MKTLNKINHTFQSVILGVAGVMIVTMFVACIVQVASRYIFKTSVMWSEELARYMLLGLTFVGSSVALHYNKHIAIDVIIANLPAKIKPYVDFITRLTMLVILGILAYYACNSVIVNWDVQTAAMRVSLGLIYSAMPIGFFGMIFDTICYMGNTFFRKDRKSLDQ